MKKIFTICLMAFSFSAFSQTPEKMSYQAVIRNSNNALLTSQNVGMRISILQGSATGNALYVETLSPSTNANGLVSIEIGSGTVVSGTFNTIDWSNGPFFVKTETDPTGGTAYTITGTSQLLSVPYALYAKTSGSSTPGPQGIQGIAGADGAAGANGTNGTNGQNSLVKSTVESAGMNCATGGIKVEYGLDANNDGVLDPTEINAALTTYVCNGAQGIQGTQGIQGVAGTDGTNGSQGIQGVQGTSGTNGQHSLSKTTAESPGVNCATGGTKVEYGLDANSNGILDAAEINASLTKYVCNGAQGATGATGATGLQGIAGPQGPAGILDLPTGGTSGQVLKTNGSGTYSWVNQTVDTKLTESEVDAFVANNGYLTAEVDGSVTNETNISFELDGKILKITDAAGTMSVDLAPLLKKAHGSQMFTTNGTFTVPADVSAIRVTMIGGGGSGGNSGLTTYTQGTGGAAGTLIENQMVSVSPGSNLTIEIGTGGNGVDNYYWNAAYNGNAGTSSKILNGATVIVEAAGGAGGIGVCMDCYNPSGQTSAVGFGNGSSAPSNWMAGSGPGSKGMVLIEYYVW